MTTESQPVYYSIEIPGIGFYRNGTITANNEDVVDLPSSVEVFSHDDQDKGIYVQGSSDRITVIGQNLDRSSSDSSIVLPIIDLCVGEYLYYAVSVPRHTNEFNTQIVESSVLIVGTENDTLMKLTVTQPVTITVDDTVTNLTSGRQYSFVINRLQTVYIGSVEDLTGTKITTNKPVSVFSGHTCAFIPASVAGCDYLLEQIPPTILWGQIYYTVPFVTVSPYIFKIVAAYDSTNVSIYCNGTRRTYIINEGEFINETLNMQEYCVIHSNEKVLVVQLASKPSQGLDGGEMMTLVPATTQYTNEISFSTIRNPLTRNYRHFVNIIVLAQYYQPDMIYLISGGVNRSLGTQEWVPIEANNVIEAYAATVTLPEGAVEIAHSNVSALMTTVVYGFDIVVGYGHTGKLAFTTGMFCEVKYLFVVYFAFFCFFAQSNSTVL